jgi:hypothetical protein
MTVWRPPGYFDPLAYKQTIAYGRYSSLHQGHGQSEDRQHEELEKVLKLFGWRLLDQYFDKGVSAGRGKHRVIGVLSRLLKRIHRREIPLPCVLTIQCFDRLTREELTVAQELFLSLINRGMAVSTTMDQAGYDKASINGNPGLLYGSIGMMLGAHGVYKVMADRAEKGWAGGRRDKITLICPGWLRPNAERTDFIIVDVEIPLPGGGGTRKVSAKVIIERIFEEAQYMGMDKIAAGLNRDGIPPFVAWSNKAKLVNSMTQQHIWRDAQIRRLIKGRTVRGEREIGHYEFKVRRKTVDGEEIEYEVAERRGTGERQIVYPWVVSEELWQRANAALEARATGRGRKGPSFTNLLQGLAKCAHCGGAMKIGMSMKKSRNQVWYYYRCINRRLKACNNPYSYKYRDVEREFLKALHGILVRLMKKAAPENDPAGGLRREIAEARAEIEGWEDG